MNSKEVLASADTKGHNFSVEGMENGFIVSLSYRQKPVKKKDAEDDSNYWDYKTKKYAFSQWSEVTEFLVDNALPQPPR